MRHGKLQNHCYKAQRPVLSGVCLPSHVLYFVLRHVLPNGLWIKYWLTFWLHFARSKHLRCYCSYAHSSMLFPDMPGIEIMMISWERNAFLIKWRNRWVTGGFPSQWASNAELFSVLSSAVDKLLKKSEAPVIRDTVMVLYINIYMKYIEIIMWWRALATG